MSAILDMLNSDGPTISVEELYTKSGDAKHQVLGFSKRTGRYGEYLCATLKGGMIVRIPSYLTERLTKAIGNAEFAQTINEGHLCLAPVQAITRDGKEVYRIAWSEE